MSSNSPPTLVISGGKAALSKAIAPSPTLAALPGPSGPPGAVQDAAAEAAREAFSAAVSAALVEAGTFVKIEEVCPFLVAHGKFAKHAHPPTVPRSPTGQYDYELHSFQRYRLTVHERSLPESQRWLGVNLRLSVMFADTGEPLKDALILYPAVSRTTRRGIVASSVTLRIGPEYYTDDRFGFATSGYFHNRRTFRLCMADDETGSPIASLLVYVSSSKKGAPRGFGEEERDRLPKRPRTGSVAQAGESGTETGNEADESSDSGSSTTVTVRRPETQLRTEQQRYSFDPSLRVGGEEPAGDELVDAFSRLNPFSGGRLLAAAADDGDPAHGPDEAPSSELYPYGAEPTDTPTAHGPDGADPKAVADSWITEIAAEGGKLAAPPLAPEIPHVVQAPPAAAPRLSHARPPYRHEGDAAREAALALVATSDAAVRSSAAAAQIRHPVTCDLPVPKRVVTACEDLATALCTPMLFDTPLFQTREGRFRARRLLEDLRLSGSSVLLEAVCAAWFKWLTAVPADPHWPLEDARAMAQHIWACLHVIAGHALHVTLDLLPVSQAYVFDLLRVADSLVEPHKEAAPLLWTQACVKRAWGCALLRDEEGALESYFHAWSLLIRTGNTPSRLEAELLVELVHHLLTMPAKWELATHLCTKLYWFSTHGVATEQEQHDRHVEAIAFRQLGIEAFTRKRWREARRYFLRAAELLEGLPNSYRVLAERVYQLLHHCAFRAADFRAVLRYSRGFSSIQTELHCPSFHELDVGVNFVKYIKPVELKKAGEAGLAPPDLEAIDKAIKTLRWYLRFTDFVYRNSPVRPFTAAHICYHLGSTYAMIEEWGKALAYFDRALQVYLRHPAYFAGHCARVVATREAADLCRRHVAGTWAGLQGPLQLPGIKVESRASSRCGLVSAGTSPPSAGSGGSGPPTAACSPETVIVSPPPRMWSQQDPVPSTPTAWPEAL